MEPKEQHWHEVLRTQIMDEANNELFLQTRKELIEVLSQTSEDS
jgi:predicted NAD-dependent protein-ADP-ribosyltransferase YbiA (DUF1768 family)